MSSSPDAPEPAVPVQEFAVTGLTCHHCVNAVSEELAAVGGVETVLVDLHPEGVSAVTVTAAAPLTVAQVAAALDEAGDYHLAPTA